jgi:nitrogen-specific signal transduction histidine kinase
MARVFEPYVTTKARGTGLGLAIVKKIVDEHHGTHQTSTTVSRSARGQHQPAAGSASDSDSRFQEDFSET